MQKQVWLFQTAADEEELFGRLAARHPLHRLGGPFFQGSLEALRSAPESLPTRQLRRGETRTHLLPAGMPGHLVAHALDDGPFAGWMRLDEVHSEVVTLVRPEPEPQGLGPSRLYLTTHVWRGGEKHRKSPEFARFANDLLNEVATHYPATAFDWMHVAPHARAYAEGGGRLHYLYQEVALAPPEEGTTPPTRPHKGR